jgi:hypothetical protein
VKDRSWFGDNYTPFDTFFEKDSVITAPIKVIGVGTVTLRVKKYSLDDGAGAHGKLRLENVLHAPDGICNMLGNVASERYTISVLSFNPDDGLCSWSLDKCSPQAPIAWLSQKRFLEILLSEPPFSPVVGPSPFNPEVPYQLRATWPVAEQQKFAALKGSQETSETSPENLPLNPTEKARLTKHWVNEFRFLRSYGLSIYSKEYQ